MAGNLFLTTLTRAPIDDDDDSSDWESSVGDSAQEHNFNVQRVDIKPNLTTRRSLITLMLAQGD